MFTEVVIVVHCAIWALVGESPKKAQLFVSADRLFVGITSVRAGFHQLGGALGRHLVAVSGRTDAPRTAIFPISKL